MTCQKYANKVRRNAIKVKVNIHFKQFGSKLSLRQLLSFKVSLKDDTYVGKIARKDSYAEHVHLLYKG